MKSAIEKIFFGETDSLNLPVTKEWKKIAEQSSAVSDEFFESLDDKQKEQYNELYNYQGKQEADRILQIYKEGFKLGLMLAVETIMG
ncbi:MAG: hypothetical protein K2O89_04890 [Clostridia bacterium]|nr:hypothetical protein [Clostridia bacterium]